MNSWDTWREAFKEARRIMAQADESSNDCAEFIIGRLRKVSPYKLKKLKRELRDFNIKTGRWKD